MSTKKNKKKWVAAATAMLAIAGLAATFAWFQSQDSAKNHFEGDVAGNDVEVIETFTPPTDWKPGDKVNKDVAIMNTGEYKSLIRVSFEEILAKLANPNSQLESRENASLLNDKKENQVLVYPFEDSRLTTGEFATGKDSVISPSQTMTVTGKDAHYGGVWTLKAKEVAVTTAAGTTYKYLSYWDNGSKKLYAKVDQYTRNSNGEITSAKPAQFKYLDLTMNDATTLDWTAAPAYAPIISIDDNGNATVVAGSDGNITLQFVNLASVADSKAGKAGNKWVYNAADGYFYYIGIVDSQGQTAQLLDSVQLSSGAGNEYSKFQFDLVVNAKSIQANKEVVNSTSWLNSTNSDIADALNALNF